MPLLFVYGTLHPDRAPDEIADVVRRFKCLGEATVVGRLEQLPDYPALRMDAGNDSLVRGIIFELPDDPEVLRRLDAYEGFEQEDPAASLFVRTRTSATLTSGERVECWIYLYNGVISAD